MKSFSMLNFLWSSLGSIKIDFILPAEKKRLQCTECEVKFAQKWNINTYIFSHYGGEIISCDIFGMKFSR